MVESSDELLREVVDDLYLRKYARSDAGLPAFTPNQAREIGREAVHDRQARLAPVDADPASPAGQRVGLGEAARRELERRKRRAGVRDFDDLLVLLRDVLADPDRGPGACARLRRRFRVVLVDEFQDTDPVQWDILRLAFHGPCTLVLVGDPKQAIYAFRGAEVLSYLEAVGAADRHETLGTNWRSDSGLLSSLHHLYGGAALGHPAIVARHVDAAQPAARLSGAAPFRLQVLDRVSAGPVGRGGFPALPALRARVAEQVAADVVCTLEGPTRLALDGESRPVRPGDIAVLVRLHKQGALLQAALDARGVPSVVAGSSSVFATQSASDWWWVLQALEQPHRAGRLRLAALTPIVGWTAEQLAAAGDPGLEQLGSLIRSAASLFAQAGLAAAFELLSARTGLERRLLGVASGERRLTDLRHLVQVLHRAAVEEGLGLAALVGWLAERVRDPAVASGSERSRRLESDAAAVQIVTTHVSKGLEFPIVYVPYGWDGARFPKPATLRLHDSDGTRVLDVGGDSDPGWKARKTRAEAEDAGEELRLLYVALTRAKCQVVLWWAPSSVTSGSPLHRLLLGRTEGEAEPAARAPVPEDAAALARLTAWAWPDEIAVEPVGPVQTTRWTPELSVLPGLSVAHFDRELDTAWRRTSYSALTHSVHQTPPAGSEPEQPDKTDEPAGTFALEAAARPDGPLSSMNGLPAGAAFGTLVHEVFEVLDAGTDDLPAELLRRCREAVGRRLPDLDPVALAAGLLPVLHTPAPYGTLASIPSSDRLTELDFELPLGGGDTPAAVSARLSDIAALLRRHLAPDDPLASYPDLLDKVDAPPLRGFLSGSIDLVLRVPGPAYVVVDYKTNRLARGELTVWDYTREAMAAEMLRAHYPLQALLYCVALHRYLSWRQPGYDPAVQLGGVQYLFVRGMVGAATPTGCGVFDWMPPPALVVALSDLLAGS